MLSCGIFVLRTRSGKYGRIGCFAGSAKMCAGTGGGIRFSTGGGGRSGIGAMGLTRVEAFFGGDCGKAGAAALTIGAVDDEAADDDCAPDEDAGGNDGATGLFAAAGGGAF